MVCLHQFGGVWAESTRSKVNHVLAGSGTADRESLGRLGQLASPQDGGRRQSWTGQRYAQKDAEKP